MTDNEGCSVAEIFTGRTAYCSGSPAAAQTQVITVKAPNNFRFGRLMLNRRKGTAKLIVKAPAAGTFLLKGTKTRPAKRKTAKAGAVVLNIRAKPRTVKLLKRRHKAKVRVRVTFYPEGGTPRTKSRPLTLIRVKKHH